MGKKSCYAILLLGGNGARFGGETPKQFLPVKEKPLFRYAYDCLNSSKQIDGIVLVARQEDKETLKGYIGNDSKLLGIVVGGKTRQESSYNGVHFLKEQGLKEDDIVLILDADRPELSFELIEENIKLVNEKGAAVTVSPSINSILLGKDGIVSSYLDRSMVYNVETPQSFAFGLISKAHEKALEDGFKATDDASLVARLGHEVALVINSRPNPKITVKEDLELYAAMKGERL